MIYSNEASGETLTFKFYDSETDAIYDVDADEWCNDDGCFASNGDYEFISDMAWGDIMDPVLFNTSGISA